TLSQPRPQRRIAVAVVPEPLQTKASIPRRNKSSPFQTAARILQHLRLHAPFRELPFRPLGHRRIVVLFACSKSQRLPRRYRNVVERHPHFGTRSQRRGKPCAFPRTRRERPLRDGSRQKLPPDVPEVRVFRLSLWATSWAAGRSATLDSLQSGSSLQERPARSPPLR